MTELIIYRPPATEIVTINIDEKTVFQKKLMGDHFIRCEFLYSSIIDITIGDFITYDSENYYINRLPSVVKLNNSSFQYSIVFESVLYNLKKKLFISSDGLADYSYPGSATDFVTNIVASINEIDAGWTVGTVDASDDIMLRFTNESCLAALIRVAEAFDMEFELSSKAISLKDAAGTTTTYRFEYGKGLGLYKLERVQVQDQNILTKVFGFGATTNIPSTYRSGAKRLIFATAGMAASGYLVSSTSGLYGIIEGQYTDNNIYPHRTGTLTGVSYAASGTGDWNSNTDFLTDSAMDFDLNSYLIEGQTATIVFKSGDNSGVECEIWKYTNATKRFYITPFKDVDGAIRPDSSNYPHVGDTYTLVNISMPTSYITTAETALQVATQSFLDENCIPMVVYTIDIDPKYASGITLDLNAGDKVTIVDTDLSINSLIRVSSVEFPLVDPYQIKAVIADFVPYTLQERLVKSAISTRKETVFVDRRISEQARRNTVNQKTLKDLLFDTDMYFDPVNLKPLSIETAYLAVGTKSRDFWLSNVTIKANYGGDANTLYVSAGSLVHLQIEITGLGYTWVIGTPLNQASLTPATAYYLYAKCSKSALTGEWILSSSQITVEQVAGYYHFLVGMLFAVTGTYRDFDFVSGMTYINGGTITTGKIQSIDTNNYFDLTNNKFRIGDADGYVDWNAAASGTLSVKGSMIITAANGYSNFTDKPTSVSGINSAEATKLNSVASGATVGAIWGTNISNQPTSVSGINPGEGTKLASVASGATVGATWGTNLSSIPSRLAETAPDNALAFTNDFLGFHASGTNWPIRIANVSGVGKFYAGDSGNNYMDWNGTILTIHGVFSGIDSNLATVAVAVGDLDGTVVNTNPNVAAQSEIDKITLTGTSGTAQVSCAGATATATFDTSLSTTASNFANDPTTIATFAAEGVTLSSEGNKIVFTSELEVAFVPGASISNIAGNLNGEATEHYQEAVTAEARIDTVTLDTGTSGTANILCDGVTCLATFFNSYTETATAFVALWAASYLTGGVVVTSSGAGIIFTAQVAGTNFTGATTIANVANIWKGNIKLVGNDLWCNEEDNDNYGVVFINRKGYNGGVTRRRITVIGGGLGYSVAVFSPTENTSLGLKPGLDIRVGALTVPNLTTSERDVMTGKNGMIIYNTTTGQFQAYDGAWYQITLAAP